MIDLRDLDDEIVATGVDVHLERMSERIWSLIFQDGNRTLHLTLKGLREVSVYEDTEQLSEDVP